MFHEEWSLDGGLSALSENNAVELYNLEEDIGEQNNLALKAPNKRDELLQDLLDWQEATNAPIPADPNPDFMTIEDSE